MREECLSEFKRFWAAMGGAQPQGLGLEVSGDHWPIRGKKIRVGSFRKLIRHGEPTVALIQITRTFDVFVVFAERPVVFASRWVRTIAFLQAVATAHFLNAGFPVLGILVAIEGIDGEAIHGVAD